MAGLLDYYRQNPELWEENKHLLAKDPAYDLGMMDLGVMSFQDRPGGGYPPLQTTGIGKYADKIGSWFGLSPDYRPMSRTLGAYMLKDQPHDREGSVRFPELTRGNIGIFMKPFTKGDTPDPWTDPNLVPPSERMNEPLYNIDKARVMAHEARHKLTEENPELYNLQPNWTGLNVQSDDPDAEKSLFRKIFGIPSIAEGRAARKQHWRNESFNRFMDLRNFPDIQFRGMSAKSYPRGLGAVDLRPEDMYFDKIWKDEWEPYAKAYDKKVEKIAARKNVPGTPIVPMGGGDKGGGYRASRPASERRQTGHGKSGMGRDPRDRMAHGGLIDIPLPGRSRDI